MLDNVQAPETHVLPATPHCPNSPMPVLVYRNVLPTPVTEQSAQEFIEQHGWKRQGIVWPAVYRRHFHPNVHECYAILSGASDVLMGVGKNDDAKGHRPEDASSQELGLLLTLREGDVIVHPAGTGHSNISDEGGYRILSFFPDGSPHWKSENGDRVLDLEATRMQTMGVPMPQDPILGGNGHLQKLWKPPLDAFFASRNTVV